MHILIIDDEQNICLTMQDIMEDEGHTASVSDEGLIGLQMITQENPDIVFLDVCMPDINGLEVLEKVQEMAVKPEVIMISGDSGIKEAVKAIKLGAYDFLEKPLTLSRVKVTLANAISYRQMKTEYQALKKSLAVNNAMVGESDAMQALREIIRKVAPTNAKVLIRGESGTGKELIARAIHDNSKRVKQPFIKFNSAAIPTELVESELFGYEKGAFTGANSNKKGKLEEAHQGTLFLDEIGDMELSAQAKILRVMQEGEFERVGSNKSRRIDTRIIAATHKNLEKMVATGLFREDLFYRLNVVPIIVPPLRERSTDIPLLLNHFGEIFAKELGIEKKKFTMDAIDKLKSSTYPGNIRELRNIIERLYILVDSPVLTAADLPNLNQKSCTDDFWRETKNFIGKKKDFEKKYLETQLDLHEDSISKTAIALGMHQGNLSRKLKEIRTEEK